jgi:hypothetical protein
MKAIVRYKYGSTDVLEPSLSSEARPMDDGSEAPIARSARSYCPRSWAKSWSRSSPRRTTRI